MSTSSRLIALIAAAACLIGSRADAANRFWTGTGIWNTTNTNWGTVTGGPYGSTWSNTAPDAAIFEGTAGTVTIAMTGTANGMTFNTTGYTVTGGTLAFGGTITVATSVTGTIESKLTGAGNLTKGGQGVLRLTNTSNDFTGTITAVGATLEMAVIPNSSNRIAFNGGTIRYVGATNTTTNRPIQIGTVGTAAVARLESSGAGTIDYTSTAAATNGGTLTAGAGLRLGGTNTGDNYWRGTLNDLSSIAIGMSKVDAGTWIVTGNSGYTGGTTISGGTLGVGSTTALGTGTVTFSANATLRAATAGTLSNIMSTGASSAVTATVDTQANAVTLSGSIGGSGNLTKIGSATLTLTSANNAYTGSTTISTGTLAIGGAGVLGGGSYAGAISNAGALAYASSANQTLSGSITGAGSLTKSGAGTLTLSNATNSFSGGSTLTAGVLAFASGALGSSGAVTMNGGTLRWATGNTEDLSSRITLVSGSTATFDTNGNDVTLANTLGGGAIGAAVTKSGGGTLSLSGSNAYTGGTVISAGTVALSGGGAIGGPVSLAASTALDISGANGNRTIGALSGSTGSQILLGGNGLTAGGATNTTFAGVISGSGGLTKAGAGVLALSDLQTFTGAARVDAGTLAIGGANTLATASQIYVASGASLDATAAGLAVGGAQALAGSGTVAGGFTIAGGATLAPGDSPGTLNATGATTWGGGGNYNWQIYTVAGGAGTGTGWDFLDSTGSLDITATGGSPFNINMWSLSGLPDTSGSASDFNSSYNYNFLIAEFDGGITGWDPTKFSVNTGAVNGTGGFTNDISGQGSFVLARGDTVSGGNANQLYLVYAAVPEPGTFALAAIGLAAAGWASCRRRRN